MNSISVNNMSRVNALPIKINNRSNYSAKTNECDSYTPSFKGGMGKVLNSKKGIILGMLLGISGLFACSKDYIEINPIKTVDLEQPTDTVPPITVDTNKINNIIHELDSILHP